MQVQLDWILDYSIVQRLLLILFSSVVSPKKNSNQKVSEASSQQSLKHSSSQALSFMLTYFQYGMQFLSSSDIALARKGPSLDPGGDKLLIRWRCGTAPCQRPPVLLGGVLVHAAINSLVYCCCRILTKTSRLSLVKAAHCVCQHVRAVLILLSHLVTMLGLLLKSKIKPKNIYSFYICSETSGQRKRLWDFDFRTWLKDSR